MTQVNTIAVIGAGTMGRGIAHVAALGGYRTILEDLLPNALRKAETEIRANLDKAVELGKVSRGDADGALSRLRYAGSVEEAAREADLVIEAVPEEMESKIEILTLLDKICRPNTILASNTSSLSITTLATTPLGSYPLTITGTDGVLTHTTSVTLVITAPDFSLTASPASQTVVVGSTANYTATVAALNGYTGTVSFSVSGLPAGASPVFTPPSVTGSGISSLAIRSDTSTKFRM